MLAQEIVDYLQANANKGQFIEAYNAVKTTILQKRNARKMRQKQLIGTDEGISLLQKKREQKYDKKKEKKKEKIRFSKLRH